MSRAEMNRLAITLVLATTSVGPLFAQPRNVVSFGTSGAVKLIKATDAMTDRDTSFLFIHGTDVPTRSVTLMCTPTRTERVGVSWGKILVPTSWSAIEVVYRFDANPP